LESAIKDVNILKEGKEGHTSIDSEMKHVCMCKVHQEQRKCIYINQVITKVNDRSETSKIHNTWSAMLLLGG